MVVNLALSRSPYILSSSSSSFSSFSEDFTLSKDQCILPKNAMKKKIQGWELWEYFWRKKNILTLQAKKVMSMLVATTVPAMVAITVVQKITAVMVEINIGRKTAKTICSISWLSSLKIQVHAELGAFSNEKSSLFLHWVVIKIRRH